MTDEKMQMLQPETLNYHNKTHTTKRQTKPSYNIDEISDLCKDATRSCLVIKLLVNRQILFWISRK